MMVSVSSKQVILLGCSLTICLSIAIWCMRDTLRDGGKFMAAGIIQIMIDQENAKTVPPLTVGPSVNPFNRPLNSPKVSKQQPPHHPSSLDDLWTAVTPYTQAWRTAHYDDRKSAYGGPAIVLLVFHDYRKSKPNLALSASHEICATRPNWFQFGHYREKPNEIHLCFAVVFKLPKNITFIPAEINLTTGTDCTKSGSAPISVYQSPSQKKPIMFAVCLYKALFNVKKSAIVDVASWIELNRLLGAESITMYYYSIDHEVTELIKQYVAEGLVELIDWKINITLDSVRDIGQLGTANDCFYRYRNRAKYIAFHDLDEIIVPHKERTWKEMMKEIDKPKRTQFRFYNSFWHYNSTSAQANESICLNRFLKIPVHFSRTSRTKNPAKRGPHKNIIKSEGAVRIGIHGLYRKARGYVEYGVPASIGYMHHYREPDTHFNEPKSEDLIMRNYYDNVIYELRNKFC